MNTMFHWKHSMPSRIARQGLSRRGLQVIDRALHRADISRTRWQTNGRSSHDGRRPIRATRDRCGPSNSTTDGLLQRAINR
ncbi:hypothetical protein Nepgr_029684 [Nepenthes gracilis]|uniref:Uncharacterized protein n=1 Tax=Nepenthes gracilis TaxID=150966 RepID=A0AAD3Y5R6_NEPGR|nr:hypothetical protein Nepgr_029684 [Nepenthes gracilis]